MSAGHSKHRSLLHSQHAPCPATPTATTPCSHTGAFSFVLRSPRPRPVLEDSAMCNCARGLVGTQGRSMPSASPPLHCIVEINWIPFSTPNRRIPGPTAPAVLPTPGACRRGRGEVLLRVVRVRRTCVVRASYVASYVRRTVVRASYVPSGPGPPSGPVEREVTIKPPAARVVCGLRRACAPCGTERGRRAIPYKSIKV